MLLYFYVFLYCCYVKYFDKIKRIFFKIYFLIYYVYQTQINEKTFLVLKHTFILHNFV